MLVVTNCRLGMTGSSMATKGSKLVTYTASNVRPTVAGAGKPQKRGE